MNIRKATSEDASSIMEHMFLAMEDILYEFIGTKDADKARELLLFFIARENNQYSYQNCLVAEIGEEIAGSINIYDGARLQELREPVVRYIRTNFGLDFKPEDETERGEYYIDTLGVSPGYQGKGLGTEILQFVIREYVNGLGRTIGLLVDVENQKAETLYLKLGFEMKGQKVLAGKKMKHLQRQPDKDL